MSLPGDESVEHPKLNATHAITIDAPVEVALFFQTVVFALGHLALGVPITISVSLLALWLGALTLWQKSLLPSMIVHVSISLFGGLAFSP